MKIRSYKGIKPGAGWSWIGEFIFDEIQWDIFSMDDYTIEKSQMRRLKVVADGMAPHKANYELYLTEKQWRLSSNGTGLLQMEKWRPGMADKLMEILTERSGVVVKHASKFPTLLRKELEKWGVNPWEKDKVDLLELQVRDKIKKSNTKRAMAAIMRKNKKAKN